MTHAYSVAANTDSGDKDAEGNKGSYNKEPHYNKEVALNDLKLYDMANEYCNSTTKLD